MATKYSLPSGDLLELYQLLRKYRGKYDDRTQYDILGLMDEVAKFYTERTGGKDIAKAENPRGAGRKPVYDKDMADRVREVYKRTGSITKTVEETGTSTTFVYKCIRN